MNCYHCKDELVWGGDHDIEDGKDYDIVSNLSCPSCYSYVEVYHAKDKESGLRMRKTWVDETLSNLTRNLYLN